jgi:pimeloyl-ACP methyl ester carboxylesterase
VSGAVAEKATVRANGYDVMISENPDRPLILLVRMASPDAGMWETIWDGIAAHFRVASFDLQQVPAARTMEDPASLFRTTAAACAEVATGLDARRFHVFGWNGGTQIAMRAAVDFPERVASLLLLDPFFELPDMRHVEKALAVKKLLFEQDRALYAYYWVMAGLTDRFIASRFDEVERLANARMQSDRFLRQDPERFMRWVRALRRNWITDEEFGRIGAATLILATGLDRWSAGPSVAMAEAVQARIGNSRLAVIENAGGHFLIEQPERFLEVAGPFLETAAGDASR